MLHSPQFLKLVNDAKSRVKEISVHDAYVEATKARGFTSSMFGRKASGTLATLPGAVHLGKGDDRARYRADGFLTPQARILCYCGGGFRSALVADNLQKMGYTNVGLR